MPPGDFLVGDYFDVGMARIPKNGRESPFDVIPRALDDLKKLIILKREQPGHIANGVIFRRYSNQPLYFERATFQRNDATAGI